MGKDNKEKDLKEKEPKKEKIRKFTVNHYLKTTDHPEKIKQMMKSLFKGECRTLEEWSNSDEKINKGRC